MSGHKEPDRQMGRSIVFESENLMRSVCGVNDRNIPYLEMLLGFDFYVKGNSMEFSGPEGESARCFSALMQRLKLMASRGQEITEPEIFMEYQAVRSLPTTDHVLAGQAVSNDAGDPHLGEVSSTDVVINVSGKSVYPKSIRQRQYIEAMNLNQIVFGIGPAGTGKTFLAIAYALSLILGGRKQKLILTRPVVEAGESLGFLPGDLSQKLNPYLRPLYDAMEWLLPPAGIRRLEENGAIEIAPLAYMRGRSIHNACVILDEAQNTTKEQMQMFLTRIGENSVAIITGDISQIDLPRNKDSGLVHAAQILHGIDGIAFLRFSSGDVVRSRIVQRIVDAYARDREPSIREVSSSSGDMQERRQAK